MNNKNYYKLAKFTGNFSKKFISFLNKEYSLSLQRDFNVFQNMKGRERAGTYKPIFKIFDHQAFSKKTGIENLSEDETMKKIKTLCRESKSTRDTTQKDQLLIEIGKYAEHAKRHGWITEPELRSLLPLPDDKPSEDDALSNTDNSILHRRS